MVGLDDGGETTRTLDGEPVAAINPNLSSISDITTARRIQQNLGLGFMGTTKQGAFDVSGEKALDWLLAPNPHERPNSDILVPWMNGRDVTRRSAAKWIIDFFNRSEDEAARYEKPFGHVAEHVKKFRDANPRDWYRKEWWQLYAQRPGMRARIGELPRFLATTTVSKHRLFVWMCAPTLPDHQLIVFARSDDYFFGVLHSRLHEVWARAQGTQLRERESGFRYTPTTCFETFPFPSVAPPSRSTVLTALSLSKGSAENPQPGAVVPQWQKTIAEAARELNQLRNAWLNPPEWTREEILEFPGSVDGPWARYIVGAAVANVAPPPSAEDDSGQQQPQPGAVAPHRMGTVRYPRLVPKDAESEKLLKKRTLTNLYNERPTWLDLAQKKLDEAVFAAYGWNPEMSHEEILERLLELNLARHADSNT